MSKYQAHFEGYCWIQIHCFLRPPSIDILLIFFHSLVLQEYWVLTESRILLEPVLKGGRIVALSISSHEKTQ